MEVLDKWVTAMPFVAYSPYATYSNPSNKIFIGRTGKPVHRYPDDPDAEAIWSIGKAAFEILNVRDREDFVERYGEFRDTVNLYRKLIEDLVLKGTVIDQCDQKVSMESIALDQREASEILSMAWGIFKQAETVGCKIIEDDTLRAEQMAFACLREVDNVLVGMDLDGRAAVSSAIHAANTLADAQAYSNGSEAFRKVRKRMAFEGAMARHRKDPKQAEKQFVFGCYQTWRGNPGRYKSKAAFARDMLDKCEHLESQKKIEDWVREWDRSGAMGTMPAE